MRKAVFMSLENQPSFIRNVGQISSHYKKIGAYGKFLNSQRLKAYRLALRREHLHFDEIIDVGCSSGSWSENWRELGAKSVIGVDPNPEAISEAESVYDAVVLGDTSALDRLANKIPGQRRTFAANAVLVHVLEDAEVMAFARDISKQMTQGDKLFVSVLDSSYYLSPDGFKPWVGPLSCTRTLQSSVQLISSSGLKLQQTIGTFINPWCLERTKWIASNTSVKNLPPLWIFVALLGSFLRGTNARRLFGEYLLVFEK